MNSRIERAREMRELLVQSCNLIWLRIPRRRVVVTAASKPVIIHFGTLGRYSHDCVRSIRANACARVAQEAQVKSNCDR